MPADQDNVQSLPAVERKLIAGFWRRLAAFLIDGIILSVPTMLVGLAFFQWAVSLGQAGRLVGFIVALLYFGVLNSMKALLGSNMVSPLTSALARKLSCLFQLPGTSPSL